MRRSRGRRGGARASAPVAAYGALAARREAFERLDEDAADEPAETVLADDDPSGLRHMAGMRAMAASEPNALNPPSSAKVPPGIARYATAAPPLTMSRARRVSRPVLAKVSRNVRRCSSSSSFPERVVGKERPPCVTIDTQQQRVSAKRHFNPDPDPSPLTRGPSRDSRNRQHQSMSRRDIP